MIILCIFAGQRPTNDNKHSLHNSVGHCPAVNIKFLSEYSLQDNIQQKLILFSGYGWWCKHVMDDYILSISYRWLSMVMDGYQRLWMVTDCHQWL